MSGPARNDLRDVFFGDFFAQKSFSGAAFRRSVCQLPRVSSPAREFVRIESRSPSQFAATLRALQFRPQLIELFFQFPLLVNLRFFLLPLRFERSRIFLSARPVLFRASSAALCWPDLFLSSAPAAPSRAA